MMHIIVHLNGDSLLWPTPGPSHARLALHPEADQRSGPDGDGADLMSTFVSAGFGAPVPFARDEHLPATRLVRLAVNRHPASYPTWSGEGKARGAQDAELMSFRRPRVPSPPPPLPAPATRGATRRLSGAACSPTGPGSRGPWPCTCPARWWGRTVRPW